MEPSTASQIHQHQSQILPSITLSAVRTALHNHLSTLTCIPGGGLTGLTVASRLSEDPDISVLVIEAGYDNHADPLVNDVRTYGQAFGSELDHGIRSTPVPWQDDPDGLLLVAGKTLGGSGSLNGASWTKGAASQYDLLPMLTGDPSWGWEEFNEHMLKAEHFIPPSVNQTVGRGAHFSSGFHGYEGPIEVAFGAEMFNGTQQPALQAAENLWPNFTRNFDAASGRTTGGTIIPNMVYADAAQNRSSPFTEYAQRQVEERPNSVILTGHRVTEIVWKEEGDPSEPLMAAGVHFQASPDSPTEYVSTSREVLLAAGSLQSPQILELSGVGDANVLSQAGIELKLDLPGVGKNMQEQTKNTVTFQAREDVDFDGTGPPSAIAFPSARDLLGEDAEEWYTTTKSHLWNYVTELEADGLIAKNTSSAAHTILLAQLDNLFNSTDAAAAEAFFTITPATSQIGIDNWNLIVLSRGTAHIYSPDPWTHPIVEASYFHHPLDLAFQIAINKASRALFNTPPLSSYTSAESELLPGLLTLPSNATDAEWEAWIKRTFTSVWHYVSTLSMMKREWGGCVDERLRVYGVRNVRAVDASVVPVQLSAHLSSSLFGVAEKGAGMIVEDWK